MSKEAYYFSHDSNARQDEKIIALRMKHGWEGYGLYWAIVEKLREASEYKLQPDYNIMSFDLRVDAKLVKSIIEDFGLFKFSDDQKFFYAERMIRNMDKKKEKSERAKIGANSRWNKNNNVLESTGELRMDMPQAYVIICEGNGEQFVKVGITSSYISRRYSGKMPYEIKSYIQYFSNDCLKIEDELNDLLVEYRYNPKLDFPGKNECYSMDVLSIVKDFSPSVEVKKTYIADASQVRRNGIKVKESKEKKSKSIDLSKIHDEFYDSLKPFVDEFGKQTVREFFDYWSEPNKSKTKLKFQMERTWDTKRRLQRWASNNFNGNRQPVEVEKEKEPVKPERW